MTCSVNWRSVMRSYRALPELFLRIRRIQLNLFINTSGSPSTNELWKLRIQWLYLCANCNSFSLFIMLKDDLILSILNSLSVRKFITKHYLAEMRRRRLGEGERTRGRVGTKGKKGTRKGIWKYIRHSHKLNATDDTCKAHNVYLWMTRENKNYCVSS